MTSKNYIILGIRQGKVRISLGGKRLILKEIFRVKLRIHAIFIEKKTPFQEILHG